MKKMRGEGIVRSAGVVALLLSNLVLAGGCVPRNDLIDRVQPGYVRKAIFNTGEEWYYRKTVAESETTSAWVIEGSGDIPIERVTFEIQEDFLLAYQAYENLPGANLADLEGANPREFQRVVIAAWPIESHFDIIQSYDALTGNEGVTITENTVDRPWYERAYMRVNWASNEVEGSFWAGSIYSSPVSYVSTLSRWENLETDPTEPFASRFSDDYIEITDSAFIGMDLLMCAAMVGYSWSAFSNCGFGEAKIRHSFRKVDPEDQYVPREYPDSYVKRGADGQPMFDPETGEVERENIYSRFGIFRTQLPTYDPGYGWTAAGRLFRAYLFDIWEDEVDELGNVVPFNQRTEKPIVYYLNVEYPERYLPSAVESADEYNRVFTRMVADLKGLDLERPEENCNPNSTQLFGENGEPIFNDVRCMFEIRRNTCNEDTVINFVNNNPDLLWAVERATCSFNGICGYGLADLPNVIGVGNLKRVCTSLESATMDFNTGKSQFEWQRIGDLRYNMLVFLNNPQRSGWGGYGPMHADARTGKTISATSYIRGNVYEVGAANIVDYIEVMNDERTIDDVVYGQDVRRHLTALGRRGEDIAQNVGNPEYIESIDSRIDALRLSGADMLPKPPNSQHLLNRLDRIRGTRVEDRIVSDLDVVLASEGTWSPLDGPAPEALKERASPLGRLTEQNQASLSRASAEAALHEAGFCFLESQIDPHWAGLALELKGDSRAEKYGFVVNRTLKHVILHEIGHNVGLAHNFEGSYDAMNYRADFWELEGQSDEAKVAGSQDELRHTTVMEYMGAKGAFGDFLGNYDEAAIRFAYGNQVQVFSGPNVDPNLEGGDALREWRYYNDYQGIPEKLCGGDCGSAENRAAVLSEREWVTFNVDDPPANEVPYLFCDNYYNFRTPFCAVFDYGSNMREIFANHYTRWSGYFFFNNFARDRLSPIGWNPGTATSAVNLTFNFVDTVAQYFYYFDVTQGEEFRETDLHDDMATVLARGLNMAAEVISTPEPERMCQINAGGGESFFFPHWALNDCDDYLELGSRAALAQNQIEIPLGDARPATLGFTDDFEDWQLGFVGSYFDKSSILFWLGFNQPRLFRFNYNLDIREQYISLYRLFEPELLKLYNELVFLDTFVLAFDAARNFGSYWCRDAEAPDRPDLGFFEPRRIIDLETGERDPGPSEDCLQPVAIFPRLLNNMPDNAMFIAHALFSSEFDAQLDMGKNMKVYVRGADDDFPAWAEFPNCEEAAANTDCYCAMIDEDTGLEYRAVQFADPATGEEAGQSVGCRLIERAQEAQDSYFADITRPGWRKDIWRAWIERLETARDLYRIFNR